MDREEESLLLYCETREVDKKGFLDNRNLNDADIEILRRWNDSGFAAYGRVPSDVMAQRISATAPYETLWCELSDDAFVAASQLRRERSLRGRDGRKGMGEFRRWSKPAKEEGPC